MCALCEVAPEKQSGIRVDTTLDAAYDLYKERSICLRQKYWEKTQWIHGAVK